MNINNGSSIRAQVIHEIEASSIDNAVEKVVNLLKDSKEDIDVKINCVFKDQKFCYERKMEPKKLLLNQVANNQLKNI